MLSEVIFFRPESFKVRFLARNGHEMKLNFIENAQTDLSVPTALPIIARILSSKAAVLVSLSP